MASVDLTSFGAKWVNPLSKCWLHSSFVVAYWYCVSDSLYHVPESNIIWAEIGYYFHCGRALLIDDIQVARRTILPPTPHPTFLRLSKKTLGPPVNRWLGPSRQLKLTFLYVPHLGKLHLLWALGLLYWVLSAYIYILLPGLLLLLTAVKLHWFPPHNRVIIFLGNNQQKSISFIWFMGRALSDMRLIINWSCQYLKQGSSIYFRVHLICCAIVMNMHDSWR